VDAIQNAARRKKRGLMLHPAARILLKNAAASVFMMI
jgi:hypothetical protein